MSLLRPMTLRRKPLPANGSRQRATATLQRCRGHVPALTLADWAAFRDAGNDMAEHIGGASDAASQIGETQILELAPDATAPATATAAR